MPTLPVLSPEQRTKGLELRRRRADIKAWVAANGNGAVYAVFEQKHPDTQGMKVRHLLMALPAIGPGKAKTILEQSGIPWDNTVKRCGPKQREKLFKLLADRKPRY